MRRRADCHVLPTVWLTAALLLSACAAPRLPVGVRATRNGPVVYVIDRGWHTDVGLPVQEVAGPLATLERGFPGVRFLTFGFGERQYLLSRQVTSGGMLLALLPSRSALLMTALKATPETAFGQPHVVVLHVSRAGLERIEASIWRELEPGPDGGPWVLAAGPYPGSVFYAARDTYDAFATCNTWTAAILYRGGLPMPTFGVLFAGQVLRAARRIAAQQASGRDG